MKKLFGCIVVLTIISLILMLDVAMVTAADQVELRMAWWGSQRRHDRTIEVIDMFHKAYPNIKIVYEFSGWGDYWTKLAPQVAAGTLPDIMQHDYSRIADWASRGLILPLNELAASGVLDFSNVSDAMLAGGKLGDELYGVNLGTNSQAIIVDLDVFKKAGIELPAPDWTWEDFEKICLEIKEKTGVWGIGGTNLDMQMWKSLYLGYGQWGYADDGKSLGYTDDQPLIDYVKMLLRLIEAGAIPSREVELSEYENTGPEGSAIVQGKAAMDYYWSNQITAIWGAAGADRNLTMIHLPHAKDGCCSANYVKPSMFFTIAANTKHPKEAATFINFFTNSLEANQVLMAERGVPVSSAVREGLEPLLEKPQLEMFAYLGRVGEYNSPIRPPDPSGHADIRDNVYRPEFRDAVLLGQISPEEGVKVLREMANEILSKNK